MLSFVPAKPLTLFKVQARLCTVEFFIKRCVTVYVTRTTRHGQALVLRCPSRRQESLWVSAKLTRYIRTPCPILLVCYKRRSNAHPTVCTDLVHDKFNFKSTQLKYRHLIHLNGFHLPAIIGSADHFIRIRRLIQSACHVDLMIGSVTTAGRPQST